MSADSQTQNPSIKVWCYAALAMVAALCFGLEFSRVSSAVSEGVSLLAMLGFWNLETTIPCLLFLGLPLALRGIRRRETEQQQSRQFLTGSSRLSTVCVCLLVFAASILCSAGIGHEQISFETNGSPRVLAFSDLPPAYHDEYSYLLQAKTFSEGRLSYPGIDAYPDLFHQFHVLNRRRTMSRYFPATGFYMTPFLVWSRPVYGHWLAGGLAAVFYYLTVLSWAPRSSAALSGLLIAVSPGLAVFSNLLLAHHPTMLSLSIFTFAFFRMIDLRVKRPFWWSILAGVGLTFAMLGRPMTAAGYGLPFGVYLFSRMWNEASTRRLSLGFAVPLIVGFGILAGLNHEATGNIWKSAYQTYTDTFTPRHRYGFNNALDTLEPEGPDVLHRYDRWASNLTPLAAIQNVWSRLTASFQWTLAGIPLLLGILWSLPVLFRMKFQGSPSGEIPSESDDLNRRGIRLMMAAFVCLHLVHIPYWFDGILHWHYVFETAPILIILAVSGFQVAHRTLSPGGSSVFRIWMAALVLGGLIPGWFQLPMFQGTSKVSAAISEQSFSRTRMEYFRSLTCGDQVDRPALVMVDETGTDPQLSYVINPPDYDSDVLVCRLPSSEAETLELVEHYSDRACYVFSPAGLNLRRWQPESADE